MLKHRLTDRICLAGMAIACLLALLLLLGGELGLGGAEDPPPYASRLFDPSRVHTLDIRIDPDDWQQLLQEAPAENYRHCELTIDGERFAGAALRLKGNNSKNQTLQYGLTRFSFKVAFDQGHSYYGLDRFSLGAFFQDNAFLKDAMTYTMMDWMGVPSPLCSYVFLTVNGEDWGLYLAVEEMAEAFIRRVYGADHGQLYKPEYRRLEDANDDVALLYTGDDPANYPNIFRTAKLTPTAADKRRLIDALRRLSEGEVDRAVDVETVLRYFVVQTFVVNFDSYLGPTGHNYYLYEEDGRIAMLPWDYNLAYGTYPLGMPEPVDDPTGIINTPIDTPYTGEVMLRRPLFHQLMLQEDCYNRYHQLYAAFVRDYLASGLLEATIEQTVRMIDPYVRRDPTKFCSYEDFLDAVDAFRLFCRLRTESVQGQLTGAIPSTLAGQQQNPEARVDASMLSIRDLGELADMEAAARRAAGEETPPDGR